MTKYGTRDGVNTVKKLIVNDKIVMQYLIPKTVAVATGALLTAHNFHTASTAVTNVGLAIQPPYPINIVMCPNVAGTAGGNDIITVAGEDQFGDNISENFIVAATAAATTAGKKAFGKIDTISIYSGQSDTNTTIKSTSIGFGYGKIVGLPWPIETNDDVISYTYDGAYATTAVDELTIDTEYNTMSMPTMGAGVTASVIYKTKLQKR